MKKHFMLIGHPLGHSISPQIHKKLMEMSSTDADYSLYEIAPTDFKDKISSLRNLNGFNVTIPYKRDIVPYLKSISARAQRCGAVNTVKCENGTMYGYNTDSIGFLRSLESAGITLKGKVLLCGAGGVARMMACEVLDRKCSLVIATPEISEAAAAKQDLEKTFGDCEIEAVRLDDVNSGFNIILNATPAGMFPKVDGCPLRHGIAGKSAAVFDAIYNPSKTVLMKEAEASGAKAVGGLSMLVWQAAAAQEIWNKTNFDSNDILQLTNSVKGLIK